MARMDRARCQGRDDEADAVTAGHVHPVPLGGDSGAKVEANLHVTIVRPDDGDALILRRVLDLIDERAVAQRSLGQARICAGTRCGVVVYQADVGTVAAVPLMVSHTRVVPAIRWPQPVVGPAG